MRLLKTLVGMLLELVVGALAAHDQVAQLESMHKEEDKTNTELLFVTIVIAFTVAHIHIYTLFG